VHYSSEADTGQVSSITDC